MNVSFGPGGTNVILLALGVLIIIMGFFATGMRGAFGRRGPTRPLSVTGRVILVATGVLVLGIGLQGLLK